MAKTGAEIQQSYRDKMRAAGYKQKNVYVPIDVKVIEGMTQASFLKKLEKVTADWSKWKTAQLYTEFLAIASAKKRNM